MQDNVVPIRPGEPIGMLLPSEIGWVLGSDGRWHPPEHIKGPFVLAFQAHAMKLVEQAAYHARIDGQRSGAVIMAPFVGAALIVGFICGWAFT